MKHLIKAILSILTDIAMAIGVIIVTPILLVFFIIAEAVIYVLETWDRTK